MITLGNGSRVLTEDGDEFDLSKVSPDIVKWAYETVDREKPALRASTADAVVARRRAALSLMRLRVQEDAQAQRTGAVPPVWSGDTSTPSVPDAPGPVQFVVADAPAPVPAPVPAPAPAPVAQVGPPRMRVVFEKADGDVIEAAYHSVIRHAHFLTLVYDHAYPTQVVYRPGLKSTGESVDICVVVYGRHEGSASGMVYLCSPTGYNVRDGSRELIALVVHKEGPVEA